MPGWLLLPPPQPIMASTKKEITGSLRVLRISSWIDWLDAQVLVLDVVAPREREAQKNDLFWFLQVQSCAYKLLRSNEMA